MSEPQPDDLAAAGLAVAVRWFERRLRGIAVVIVAFIVFVLVTDHLSTSGVVVSIVAAFFLAAGYLALRAFAAIGRSP